MAQMLRSNENNEMQYFLSKIAILARLLSPE